MTPTPEIPGASVATQTRWAGSQAAPLGQSLSPAHAPRLELRQAARETQRMTTWMARMESEGECQDRAGREQDARSDEERVGSVRRRVAGLQRVQVARLVDAAVVAVGGLGRVEVRSALRPEVEAGRGGGHRDARGDVSGRPGPGAPWHRGRSGRNRGHRSRRGSRYRSWGRWRAERQRIRALVKDGQ